VLLVASGAQLVACMFLPDALALRGCDAPVWVLPCFAAPYLLGVIAVAAGLVTGPRSYTAALWVARVVVIAVGLSNCAMMLALFVFWLVPGVLILGLLVPLIRYVLPGASNLAHGLTITAMLECPLVGLYAHDVDTPGAWLVLLGVAGTLLASWRWLVAVQAARRGDAPVAPLARAVR